MDLSQARAASLALDFDVDAEDEEAAAERTLASATSGLTQTRYEPAYSDGPSGVRSERSPQGVNHLTEEDEELWDRL
ncbi:hypothetical protein A1Q2_07976 [Trichosporon asahii var. asahii CBS 8904]|uniref:Uncharacterized protein n=1 Tax=Trichosporon asahii var. asahii (strain CBS 8904) TaxID=1220162 RepID=K1VM27_TRIAC|nr:hypothetical protein A1Q2_07976 [Trichosporon asahii var. asahii CBS 8904]